MSWIKTHQNTNRYAPSIISEKKQLFKTKYTSSRYNIHHVAFQL